MNNYLFMLAACCICWADLCAQDMFPARQLTSDPARQGFPDWSPKGDALIYQYTDMTDTAGRNGLWKISSDGTGVTQIFKGVAEHPKWSPDGQNIVFDADTGQKIKMISSDGGDVSGFLPDSIRIRRGGMPCWSPDGAQMAFLESTRLSLCLYQVASGEVSRIFSEEGKLPIPGCWSSDGNGILVALMDMETRKSDILLISADGKRIEKITGHHENFYRYLAQSPDGGLLVYAAMEGDYLGLYIMRASGGKSLPLAVSAGHNESPAWSPDGTKIAFGSNRSGSANIWVMDIDVAAVYQQLDAIDK